MGSRGLIPDALWVIQHYKKGFKKGVLLFTRRESSMNRRH